jgi:proteic killer suppression protein
MIKSFKHAGIKRFFEAGTKSGIQPKHAKRLRLQLGRLDAASAPGDMDLPGWRLHSLKGGLQGFWAIWVDENWRLTFRFDGDDAELVDYQDYH